MWYAQNVVHVSSTFVLLVLSERLHAGHQDVVVAQKLIKQEATKAVSKTLVLHGI